MGRARIIGMSLAVVFASGALMVGSASAAAPEFGRCLKVAPKSLGNFDSAKCTKTAGEDAGTEAEKLKKGNYQWFPGVVNNKFTTKLEAGTFMVFESVAGGKAYCSSETGAGEYASPTEVAKLVLKFSGCENSKVGCESSGAGDDHITTASLAGSLGYETITEDTPAKDKLALELHAEGGGNVVEFNCAGLSYVIRGSVLHRVTANAMKLTTTERFRASRGIQKPDHFAGGVAGEHVLELSLNSQPFAQVGLTMTETLTNEEKVEASAVN
jgi:hypothetical protein